MALIVDVVAGFLIGIGSQTWLSVLGASMFWGVLRWLLTEMTKTSFAPPKLSRFIVWWLLGFNISLVIGSAVYAVKSLGDAS